PRLSGSANAIPPQRSPSLHAYAAGRRRFQHRPPTSSRTLLSRHQRLHSLTFTTGNCSLTSAQSPPKALAMVLVNIVLLFSLLVKNILRVHCEHHDNCPHHANRQERLADLDVPKLFFAVVGLKPMPQLRILFVPSIVVGGERLPTGLGAGRLDILFPRVAP